MACNCCNTAPFSLPAADRAVVAVENSNSFDFDSWDSRVDSFDSLIGLNYTVASHCIDSRAQVQAPGLMSVLAGCEHVDTDLDNCSDYSDRNVVGGDDGVV